MKVKEGAAAPQDFLCSPRKRGETSVWGSLKYSRFQSCSSMFSSLAIKWQKRSCSQGTLALLFLSVLILMLRLILYRRQDQQMLLACSCHISWQMWGTGLMTNTANKILRYLKNNTFGSVAGAKNYGFTFLIFCWWFSKFSLSQIFASSLTEESLRDQYYNTE